MLHCKIYKPFNLIPFWLGILTNCTSISQRYGKGARQLNQYIRPGVGRNPPLVQVDRLPNVVSSQSEQTLPDSEPIGMQRKPPPSRQTTSFASEQDTENAADGGENLETLSSGLVDVLEDSSLNEVRERDSQYNSETSPLLADHSPQYPQLAGSNDYAPVPQFSSSVDKTMDGEDQDTGSTMLNEPDHYSTDSSFDDGDHDGYKFHDTIEDSNWVSSETAGLTNLRSPPPENCQEQPSSLLIYHPEDLVTLSTDKGPSFHLRVPIPGRVVTEAPDETPVASNEETRDFTLVINRNFPSDADIIYRSEDLRSLESKAD